MQNKALHDSYRTQNPSNKPVGKKIAEYFDRQIQYILIAPMVIILVGLIIYPFIFNINLSFRDVTLLNFRSGDWKFIGFQNYITVLSDPFVQRAFVRTLSFTFFTVLIQLFLGMIAALAFNTNFKGKGFLMPLALAPMMITPVAVGLFWRILLNYRWGIINYFLSLVGIEPQLWLSDPLLAYISIVNVQVWWGVSFVFLVILGGLSALPQEPYEAAVMDGASSWQLFRYITFPLLRPVLSVVAVIRIIDALREFDIIYTLTGGGPGDSTRVFTLELFNKSFEEGLFGIGAAQSMILIVVIMFFTSGLIRALSSDGNSSE
jgi:multiple sugar transport system permease protein